MSSSNQTHGPITDPSHYLPVNPLTDKGIKLTLKLDPSVPGNDERFSEFEAVAASEPQSIADFMIRLE